MQPQFGVDQDPCIKECVLVHEKCHIQDMMGYGGKPCEGLEEGTVLGWQDIGGLGQSEIKCRSMEIDCLIQQMGKTKPCDACTKSLEDRLKQIWNYTGGGNKL